MDSMVCPGRDRETTGSSQLPAIDGPAWGVLGQVLPRGAGPNEPARGVEAVAEAVDALAGVFGPEARLGPTKAHS